MFNFNTFLTITSISTFLRQTSGRRISRDEVRSREEMRSRGEAQDLGESLRSMRSFDASTPMESPWSCSVTSEDMFSQTDASTGNR